METVEDLNTSAETTMGKAAVEEELEDGELEEGEIDEDEEQEEEKNEEIVEMKTAEPPKEIKRDEVKDEVDSTKSPKQEGAEQHPSEDSTEDDDKEDRKRKRKKRRKKKHKEEKEKESDKPDKQKKKKRARYVDHDKMADNDGYPEKIYNTMNWPGFAQQDTAQSYTPPMTEPLEPPGPYDSPYSSPVRNENDVHVRVPAPVPPPPKSPPGPYDSPYESPPGPYDSPSDDEENYGGSPSKMQRFGSKNPTMMSLLADDCMGEISNEQEDIYKKGKKGLLSASKLKKLEKSKMYREIAKEQQKRKKVLLDSPGGCKKNPCKFYMEGKCNKGEDCPYSHDFQPPKKPEVCKFYLISSCGKGDNCLYMHGEYPCRFYHLTTKCFQEDHCKFSHDKLTEEGKTILERIVAEKEEKEKEPAEKSPVKKKTLLSTPSSSTLSHANSMSAAVKRIPSLFDIEVFPPNQGPRQSGPGARPPGPGPRPPGHGSRMSSPQHRPMRPFYGELSPSRPPLMRMPHGMMRHPPPRPMMRGPGPGPMGGDGPVRFYNNFYNQQTESIQSPEHEEPGTQGSDNFHETMEEGASEDRRQTYDIPTHLAPKQRELFLRIQSQQRENVPEEEDSGDLQKEIVDDNWYSSDEEEGSAKQSGPAAPKQSLMADLFQTLNQPQTQPALLPATEPAPVAPAPAVQPEPPSLAPQHPQPTLPKFDIAQMLNAIRNQVTAAQGSSNVVPPLGMPRDPRVSQQGPVPGDPRAQSSNSNNQVSPTSDPRQHAATETNARQSNTNGNVSPLDDVTEKVPLNSTNNESKVPYMLYTVTTENKPYTNLPSSINQSNPKFKHDPRLQRQTSKSWDISRLQRQHSSGKTNGNNASNESSQKPASLDLNKSETPTSPPAINPTKTLDPRMLRNGSKTDQSTSSTRVSNAGALKVTDPRTAKAMDTQLKPLDPRHKIPGRVPSDPRSLLSNIKTQDPRVQRTLSAPTGISLPPPMPALLQKKPVDPRQNKPQADSKPSDPRLARQSSAGSNSSIPDTMDQNTALSHRNDPRFRKKNKSEAQQTLPPPPPPPPPVAPVDPRQGRASIRSVDYSVPVSATQVRNMEYSSPLGGQQDISSVEQSGYNSYNRLLNRPLQQQLTDNNLMKNNGQNKGTSNNAQVSEAPSVPVIPQLMAVPILPEQLQMPPGVIASDEKSLKDMFKTIDPTASPFC